MVILVIAAVIAVVVPVAQYGGPAGSPINPAWLPVSDVHGVAAGKFQPMAVPRDKMPALADPDEGREPGGQDPGDQAAGGETHGRFLDAVVSRS